VNFHPGKGFTKDQDKLVTELKRTRLDAETDVVGPDPSGPFSAGAPSTDRTFRRTGHAAVHKILKNQPSKALDDAVYEAAELLSDRGRSRRKIIFLISDGQNAKNNKNSYETVVKELLRYEISVYSSAWVADFWTGNLRDCRRTRTIPAEMSTMRRSGTRWRSFIRA